MSNIRSLSQIKEQNSKKYYVHNKQDISVIYRLGGTDQVRILKNCDQGLEKAA